MNFCTYCDKLSYTSKLTLDGKMIYYCSDHALNITVDQDIYEYGISDMKKLYALLTIIATAILSGVALSKFLKWAGKQEDFFDFDLDEDIDNEQF